MMFLPCSCRSACSAVLLGMDRLERWTVDDRDDSDDRLLAAAGQRAAAAPP